MERYNFSNRKLVEDYWMICILNLIREFKRVSNLLKNPSLLLYSRLNMNLKPSEQLVLLKALRMKENLELDKKIGKKTNMNGGKKSKLNQSSFGKKYYSRWNQPHF